MSSSALLQRLERDTVATLCVLMLAAVLIRPSAPRFALGVAGGGALVGLAYWAVRALVGQAADRAISGRNHRGFRARPLVKFFTRHGILALAGYGMMARLELHPVGMLLGVSAPAVAASLEAVRTLRHARR